MCYRDKTYELFQTLSHMNRYSGLKIEMLFIHKKKYCNGNIGNLRMIYRRSAPFLKVTRLEKKKKKKKKGKESSCISGVRSGRVIDSVELNHRSRSRGRDIPNKYMIMTMTISNDDDNDMNS